MSPIPLCRTSFFADVAAIYGSDDRPNCGSGRLIAPNLILTAGHVVDYPTRRNPTRSGWKAAILRNRAEDGSWKCPAHDAELVWRGRDQLDLALLRVEGELRPTLQPVLASYNGIPPINDVDAVGFPEGRETTDPNRLDDYHARGILRIPGQLGPYVWNVPLADKPNRVRGWRGMSGAGVCRFEPDGCLYLFGAVEEVPVNFSHQLQVAQVSQAFRDPDFVKLLHAALDAEPTIVAFELQPSRRDLGIARNFQFTTRAFKNEYLLSETNPVPFGGRDEELRRLDDWLLDPSSHPRLLVTAPAGRGKSALLVHWMKNLQDGGVCGDRGWQLAFMPISIRVGTNIPKVFYQGLASRLAEIIKEESPNDFAQDADDFRMSVRVLLEKVAESNRCVLVVIDGLDEAPQGTFDAAIFPLNPSNKNLRVLLSARWQSGDIDSNGWLVRLSWDRNVRVDSFELRGLEEDHIRDVFVKLGAPLESAGSDPALVAKLLDLTDGEPLLIRYYAEDLWKLASSGARVTRADLDTLKPGFSSYFARWLDHQETLWRQEGAAIDRENLDKAVSVLAFALGPLEDVDFRAVFACIDNSKRPVAIDRLITPLRRFVIGNGKRGSGYILSHPRIGRYLQDERFSATADEFRSAFVDWGRASLRAVNDDPEKPERASPYLLQFLLQHFDNVDATPTDYAMMVDKGWLRARLTPEGGAGVGLAADARAVLDRTTPLLARRDATAARAALRASLVLASLKSQAAIPPALLALARRNDLIAASEAELSAAALKPADQSEAFALLAEAERESKTRKPLLERSLDAACQVARGTETWRSCESTANILEKMLDPSRVAAFAERLTMDDIRYVPDGLALLCARLADSADLMRLMAAIGDRVPEFWRARFYSTCASRLTGSSAESALRAALAAARAVGNIEEEVKVLLNSSPDRARPRALEWLASLGPADRWRGSILADLEKLFALKVLSTEEIEPVIEQIAAQQGDEQFPWIYTKSFGGYRRALPTLDGLVRSTLARTREPQVGVLARSVLAVFSGGLTSEERLELHAATVAADPPDVLPIQLARILAGTPAEDTAVRVRLVDEVKAAIPLVDPPSLRMTSLFELAYADMGSRTWCAERAFETAAKSREALNAFHGAVMFSLAEAAGTAFVKARLTALLRLAKGTRDVGSRWRLRLTLAADKHGVALQAYKAARAEMPDVDGAVGILGDSVGAMPTELRRAAVDEGMQWLREDEATIDARSIAAFEKSLRRVAFMAKALPPQEIRAAELWEALFLYRRSGIAVVHEAAVAWKYASRLAEAPKRHVAWFRQFQPAYLEWIGRFKSLNLHVVAYWVLCARIAPTRRARWSFLMNGWRYLSAERSRWPEDDDAWPSRERAIGLHALAAEVSWPLAAALRRRASKIDPTWAAGEAPAGRGLAGGNSGDVASQMVWQEIAGSFATVVEERPDTSLASLLEDVAELPRKDALDVLCRRHGPLVELIGADVIMKAVDDVAQIWS